MAWTSDDLTMIEDAIKSGALTVRYKDRTVTYQSLDALRRVRAEMQDEIARASRPRRPRTTRIYQKGR